MPQPAASSQGPAVAVYRGVLARLKAHWEVWPAVAFALALVLIYFFTAPVLGLPFDDSYISLQFARNLADHGFLTFDGETASSGATSLLHVATLAVFIKLGGDPVKVSLAVGVVLHLTLVVTLYWLSWTIFRDRIAAALAGASVGVIGFLVYDALNGMETTLFLVVSTAAAAAFLGAKSERRLLLAGAFTALAVLSRPEGVLLLGAMGLFYLVSPDRREPIMSAQAVRRLALLAGPSLIVLAGLAGFYWATTGSPTPGTATAKFLFFREFDLRAQTRFDFIQAGVSTFVGPVLPWLLFALVALRRRETLLFAFFWVAFILMYFFLFPGGTGHYWNRYQHIFLPAIAVFGAAGLVSLVRSVHFRTAEIVSAALIGVVFLGAVYFQYNGFRERYKHDVELNETRQVGIALYLRDVVPEGEAVATHDIGVIGYYSEREVIDLVGLIDPDAVDYHKDRRLKEYIAELRPSYIVAFPSWENRYLRLGLREDPLFELVEVFEGEFAEPFEVYKTHYPDEESP